MNFAKDASAFIKNPLGIFGLFIVLVYSIASLILGTSETIAKDLVSFRSMVGFVIVMPFALLAAFYSIATKYPTVFFSPSDFKDEAGYVELIKLILKDKDDADSASPAGVDAQARRVATLRVTNPEKFDKRILWVDDNPSNNRIIANAFERLGFDVVIAKSTEEAMKRLGEVQSLGVDPFSSIISDMGRPESAQAGYDLLAKVRDLGLETPFYIYAGSNKREHDLAAREHGGNGSTNSSAQLMKWIVGDALDESIWK